MQVATTNDDRVGQTEAKDKLVTSYIVSQAAADLGANQPWLVAEHFLQPHQDRASFCPPDGHESSPLYQH